MLQFSILPEIEDKKDEFVEWINDTFVKLTINKTHQDVFNVLVEAKSKGYIDDMRVNEMLKFRKKAIDLFSLMDVDNDKTLYKINKELNDFWDIMEVQYKMYKQFKSAEKAEKFREWIDEGHANL